MLGVRGELLKKHFVISRSLKTVIKAVTDIGGVPLAVGGCVRDHLLGMKPKDIDIEVYGTSLSLIEQALEQIGDLHSVGRSFGVLKVTVGDETFDVSLPRLDNKIGQGHKGFVVDTSKDLSFKEASARRDFTINAMGVHLLRQELFDEYGGLQDLRAGILRHVSPAFSEDPLRVFRGCQFAARFGYSLHPETIALCQQLKSELTTLPRERIVEEMRKLVLGRKPSLGLEALRLTGAWELFPELMALEGCLQEEEWHPEGDVWIHTKMVVDAAAKIILREKLEGDAAIIIMLGAMCHDLGKPPTTKFEEGRWRSRGHESAGDEPTRSLLANMGFPEAIVEEVVPLVREHLKPHQLYRVKEEISMSTIRRLASRVSINKLCLVAEADFLGRTTPEALAGHDPATAWLLEVAKDLQVAFKGPEPILMGRHLIERGMKPGREMGDTLKAAFEAQLDGEFSDLAGALKWLDARR